MKDVAFIKQMPGKGKTTGEIVKAGFSGISFKHLNWKPSPEAWSLGQCLDYLTVSNMQYFPALQKIAERKYKMTFWERWNPLSTLFGRMLVQQLQEKVTKKVKASKVFRPDERKIDPGIPERFQKHLDTLLECMGAYADADVNMDRVHITSPVSKFITYSLRNAITVLIQHEHRHINQALRVKAMLGTIHAG